MATADPRFAAWIPVVSAKCIDPFGSLFFCFRQSVKRYIRFLVESVFTVNRRTALSHFPPFYFKLNTALPLSGLNNYSDFRL